MKRSGWKQRDGVHRYTTPTGECIAEITPVEWAGGYEAMIVPDGHHCRRQHGLFATVEDAREWVHRRRIKLEQHREWVRRRK